MNRNFKKGVVWLVLLIAVLLVTPPAKVEKRLVIIAKTPVVVPSAEDIYTTGYYLKYERLINDASEEFNVPVPLIAAVINAESGFNPHVVSRAGAMGLMQLMPATWNSLGGSGSPFNPSHNIRLGTKYLRELLDQYRGNLRLTIAAYNAGPGAVSRYGGVPPYRETRRYVPRVLKYYEDYKKSLG